MKPSKVDPVPTRPERNFEQMFREEKRAAEERLAIIRSRIRTLERAIAVKENRWNPHN